MRIEDVLDPLPHGRRDLVSGLQIRDLSLFFRVSGFGFQVSGFGVSGLGVRGFGVSGFGGIGFWVSGFW